MRFISSAVLLSLLAFNAQAEPPDRDRPIRAVLGLTFGWDWAQTGQDQDVLLVSSDPAPDFFDANTTTSSKPLGGASIGIEFPIRFIGSRWQTSLAYYQSGDFTVSGIDYFYSLPNYGNKEYSYKVNSQRALLENKLLVNLSNVAYWPQTIYVYFVAAIGIAFNDAYGYKEKSLDLQTPADGVFSPHMQTSPTYSLGAGFEYEPVSTLRFGIGYRFTDLGKVTLGDYNNGDTDSTLNINNTWAQEALLQMSILF